VRGTSLPPGPRILSDLSEIRDLRGSAEACFTKPDPNPFFFDCPVRMLRKFATMVGARWRVGLLVLLTTVVWCGYYDRWTAASWSIPTEYRGDALEILARIQAASEGDTTPLRPQIISRLGAPFGANWSAYPSSDLLLIWSLGQLARLIGVFPTANVALLLAAITAALSFYGCARWLRVRWEWAMAGALLFAFTFQTFNRGLPHLFLLFSWTVPLALLACGLVAASRRLRLRGATGVFCIATAAVIGIGNPYTLFLFLQLLGWALIAQWFGGRRRENLITGGIALVVAIAGFFIVESHVWLFAPDTAANSPLIRNYGSTERYALKPLELFVPPASHRWEPLAFMGQRYVRWSDWRTGEPFAPYLGILGIIGLVWLAAMAVKAVMARRRVPGPALPAAWVLIFSSVGGVTNLIAFFTGLVIFRATNRFSIFLSAIVLLFLMARLARWSARRPAFVSITAALGLAVLGLVDQIPRAPGPARQEAIARRVEGDQALARQMQARLPPGAMVFQLPVVGFPEVIPPHQLADYEYFRPYLAAPSLRFSYGMLKGRSRGGWQRDLERRPLPEVVAQLERYGFGAIYFNRHAYADGGDKLVRDLTALGLTRRLVGPENQQVVILLEPAPHPELPMARSLTFGHGWHEARPGQPRWAYGPAALSYFNPHSCAVHGHVRLVMSGVGNRNLAIRLNGGEPIAKRIDGRNNEVNLHVTLRPGINRFDVESLEPAVRLSEARDQLRAFAVHESFVEFERGVVATNE
jgi:phosphoglycerol transferase